MKEKDDGGPAFPETRWDERHRHDIQWYGMSMRDYFASAAMNGMVVRIGRHDSAIIAHDAYVIADAMLAERDK